MEVYRFIKRLHVSGIRFTIERYIRNANLNTSKNHGNDSNYKMVKYPHLQLYHTSRQDNPETIESIFKNGLKIGHQRGNKGNGVYLSSHSRYSYSYQNHHVFICNVDIQSNPLAIKRFRSEIYSPYNDYEYVIQDPSIIQVHSYLKYRISAKDKIDIRWNNVCCENCPEHVKKYTDPSWKRCDCELFPTIINEDVVSNNAAKI